MAQGPRHLTESFVTTGLRKTPQALSDAETAQILINLGFTSTLAQVGTENSFTVVQDFAAGITVETAFVFVSPTVPAAANSTGITETFRWEAGFLYLCVATNTWQRVAIATWP